MQKALLAILVLIALNLVWLDSQFITTNDAHTLTTAYVQVIRSHSDPVMSDRERDRRIMRGWGFEVHADGETDQYECPWHMSISFVDFTYKDGKRVSDLFVTHPRYPM